VSLDALYGTMLRGPTPTGPSTQRTQRPSQGADFQAALDALLHEADAPAKQPAPRPTDVSLSRHAARRLESRGIELGDHDLTRISEAMDQLDAKGARESLLLMDEHAFIVGVPKRVVITALTRDEAMGNIFTGIDSTLVL
jgi:flagellar operon protein